MKNNRYAAIFVCLLSPWMLMAQGFRDKSEIQSLKPLEAIAYEVEMQGAASKGQPPLWLNANRYGLSSIESTNGYVRAAVERSLQNDSLRRWGIGYGLDVVAPLHYTSPFIVQQAFGELRWLHGVLSVGSKERPLELKNSSLSTGSQTLGINARPIPQVRLELPDYWRLPFANGWLHFKGHIAYGMMTDDGWQKDFTQGVTKHTEKVLFHSKAGFLKIGNPYRFVPWSLELGLEMAANFGGTSYLPQSDGTMHKVESKPNLNSFVKAFVPGGGDVVEEGTVYQNALGNHLGSWMARLNYDNDNIRWGLYFEKFFEDHSSMLQVDYNGYGTGDEWNVKKDRKFFVYDFKDMLLGMELNLKRGWWLRNIVLEYIYTKYQSGPVYHDHTPTWNEHISGIDSYYNHYIYTGWQHWGQVIGNPLYLSPIYNQDGKIDVKDNRFVAWHLGFSGDPSPYWSYRVLATYRQGYGTYYLPYNAPKQQFYGMAELIGKITDSWKVAFSLGADIGNVQGNNYGCMLTVTKTGWLTTKKKK